MWTQIFPNDENIWWKEQEKQEGLEQELQAQTCG